MCAHFAYLWPLKLNAIDFLFCSFFALLSLTLPVLCLRWRCITPAKLPIHLLQTPKENCMKQFIKKTKHTTKEILVLFVCFVAVCVCKMISHWAPKIFTQQILNTKCSEVFNNKVIKKFRVADITFKADQDFVFFAEKWVATNYWWVLNIYFYFLLISLTFNMQQSAVKPQNPNRPSSNRKQVAYLEALCAFRTDNLFIAFN